MDANLAFQLSAFLIPYIPRLLSIGAQAATDDDSPERARGWQKAQDIWGQLFPKMAARPAAKEAVEDVAQNPDDADTVAAFRRQTKKILQEDDDLVAEITRLLDEVRGDGIVIVGNNNVAQQGDGNINIGKARDVNIDR